MFNEIVDEKAEMIEEEVEDSRHSTDPWELIFTEMKTACEGRNVFDNTLYCIEQSLRYLHPNDELQPKFAKIIKSLSDETGAFDFNSQDEHLTAAINNLTLALVHIRSYIFKRHGE